ncbi:hypothetical protein GOODEAATRI_004871 [Goodea atripinnis]|uniref:Uncharacterized protein n=1 Tax=Goodea atripinnis TaxID=208336 RepID=A0ABV0PL27_9TELE
MCQTGYDVFRVSFSVLRVGQKVQKRLTFSVILFKFSDDGFTLHPLQGTRKGGVHGSLANRAIVLDRKRVACPLKIGGEFLPQVEDFKYLGVLFTSERTM